MNDSTFCTGSHLNRRTFNEDEYWPSFQSTIVSGQVMSVDNNQTNEEASTMESYQDSTMTTTNATSVEESTNTNENSSISIRDQSSIADDKAEENPLNLNLDAISDPDLDEYFFDCPSFDNSPANLMRPTAPSSNRRLRVLHSPQPQSQPIFYQVQFASPPKTNSNNNNFDCSASPCKRRPASATRISPELHVTSIASDQSPAAGKKTGSYLAEMIEDFNDLNNHPTSTPTFSTDSGNPSTASFSITGASYSRKNLDTEFQNAETLIITSSKQQHKQQHEVSISDKENFFAGKYSRFVNDRRNKQSQQKPSVVTRSGKVNLLAKYFQSRVDESIHKSKSIKRSKIPVSIRKSLVKKSPQAITRLSGSPSYKIRRSYRLVSSRSGMRIPAHHPSSATSFSSNGNDSFLTRNQPKNVRSMRVKSCSDAVDDDESESMDAPSKSHSTGDLTSDSSVPIKAHHDSLKINRRTYLKAEQSKQQQQNSSSKIISPKKYSAINTRRSVNLMVKNNVSPAKPVREIRKMFTPRASKTSNANISQKKDTKLVVPKILISHHS